MLLRLLSVGDAEAFHHLRLRALRDEPLSFGSTYEQEVQWTVADRARQIDSVAGRLVIGAIKEDAGLVGVVGLTRSPHQKTRHRGDLWGLYVTPESRRQGVARALLADANSRAEALEGLEQVALGVPSASEGAHHLFLSAGYHDVCVHPRYYKVQDAYVDLVWMAKAVRQPTIQVHPSIEHALRAMKPGKGELRGNAPEGARGARDVRSAAN